jgi:hypothetical protein
VQKELFYGIIVGLLVMDGNDLKTKVKTRNWRLIGLCLFIIIGLPFAMPCLCLEGATTGKYKMILYLLISIRLIWDVFKKDMKLYDYLIYFSILIGFAIWANLMIHL